MTSILPPSASETDDAELTERPRPRNANPDQYTLSERTSSLPVIAVAMVAGLIIVVTIVAVFASLGAK